MIIEQAKGVIAARDGVSVEIAFARLRSYARSHNVRIHELAHAVVAQGLRV